MEFHFTNDRPIYLQLVEQLELYIVTGQFPPGERLPSVRDLSNLAKVNPNTMQRALTELEDRRLIITERTNGKFVTDDQAFLRQKQQEIARAKVQKFLAELKELGVSRANLLKYLRSLKEEE